MKRNKLTCLFIVPLIILSLAVYTEWAEQPKASSNVPTTVAQEPIIELVFPVERYPETAAHIKEAIQAGESAVCTLDRKDGDKHRAASLKGVPTKKGYDRDEWPMAFCAEGGAGADVKYIIPADNRGAGSWVSNQVEKYPDGTHIKIIVP